MGDKARSSTVEYQREKNRRFYYSRKERDPEAHRAKQTRNSKVWKAKNTERLREYSAEKYQGNPEYYRTALRKSLQKLRVRVIGAYGGRCSCGETDPRVLTLDHVGGWGNKERASTTKNAYRLAEEKGYPDSYQILCRNCNMRDQFVRRRSQNSSSEVCVRERQRRLHLKSQTFEAYGGLVCVVCKGHQDDIDILTLDHTEPCLLGRVRDKAGWCLYTSLRQEGFPPGFSVMCFNCNWLKYLLSISGT